MHVHRTFLHTHTHTPRRGEQAHVTIILQMSHWLISLDSEYKNCYWNQCTGTVRGAACSFTATDPNLKCAHTEHARMNERAHTHTYIHIHTGNMQFPGGGIRGQDMLWNITLCIGEICINALMSDRECVVFKHSLCYLLWWTSWLQRAGVSEMDFLCVCVCVCVRSLLLQWWSQKPVCVFSSLLPVVACNVIDPEGVADVFLAFVLVLAEAWQDVDLIELGVDGGSLGKARHRYCGGRK